MIWLELGQGYSIILDLLMTFMATKNTMKLVTKKLNELKK